MAIPLSTFITVNLATAQSAVQRTDFSIPLLLGYNTVLANRAKRYNSGTILTEMVSDGFTVNDPLYKMAQAITSRSDFAPTEIVVGRRDNAPVQAIDLTMATVTGETISVTVSYNGTTETYTRVGTGAPAADATALAATINAGAFGVATLIAATGVGSDVQIRQGAGPTTGQIFYFDDLLYCTLDDVTADPGVVADLTAVRAYDDNWYCVFIDSTGGAENTALTVAVESLEKIFIVSTQDYDIAAGTAGNLAKVYSAANYTRSYIMWSRYSMEEYPGVRVGAYALPRNAGSYTVAWKDITGWTVDSEITAAEYSNISTDLANANLSGGIGVAPGGVMPNSSWLDIVILSDWIRDAIRTALTNALRRNEKIPYTNDAGEIALTEIEKVYKEGADNGGFVLEDFSGTYLDADDQTAGNVTARHFAGVRFSGTFAGAVHTYTITGTVS